MPTRNINLTDRLDRFVEKQVESGRYGNASEVIRDGIRLMERRDQEERAKLKWLRAAVKEGLDEMDRGEVMEFRSIAELEENIDRLAEEVSAPTSKRRLRA